MSTFEPSYTAALAHLNAFVPKAGRNYARFRNFDLPDHPHVSRLSPYLRHRVITEAEVVEAVLHRHSETAAEKFLQEVCWRSYWKAYLDRRPGIWAAYRNALQSLENRLATEAGLRAAFQDACEGRTGIDGFDAWAKELIDTGYLHNHARMWFTSIWIFTLRLPWELGADFFLRHLLDGDPASNTLSWRWVAGLHTRGKTYAARPDNIAKYTEGRHQPTGLTPADQVRAIDGPPGDSPGPVPQSDPWPETEAWGLVLTEDDLSPSFLLRGTLPRATAILLSTAGRSQRAVSPNVLAFTEALAKDIAARFRPRLGDIPILQSVDDLQNWAVTNQIDHVAHPYTPVGPGRSALRRFAKVSELPLSQHIRAWDAAALPHATAGFFKFKAQIPKLLDIARKAQAA